MSEDIQSTEAASSPDIDTIYNNIQQYGSAEGPSASTPEKVASQPQPDVTPSKPQMFKFKALGKEIEADEEKMKQYASMGYDYSAKIGATNIADAMHKLSHYEALSKQVEDLKKLERYKEYEDYAAKNPAWREHLHQSWEMRTALENGLDPENPIVKELATVKTQLQQYLSSQQQAEQQKIIQEGDAKLAQEIKSIRDQYADLDFDQLDDSGKSLEYRVLEHANQNDIRSFKTAFLDFYHPTLVQRAADKAKEEAAKQIQQRTKAGFTGIKTPATAKANGAAPDSFRNLSDKQVHELALKSIGLL